MTQPTEKGLSVGLGTDTELTSPVSPLNTRHCHLCLCCSEDAPALPGQTTLPREAKSVTYQEYQAEERGTQSEFQQLTHTDAEDLQGNATPSHVLWTPPPPILSRQSRRSRTASGPGKLWGLKPSEISCCR